MNSTKIFPKDLSDNLKDKINSSVSADYVDQQIATVTSTGIPKLQVYPLAMISATEGQTEFEINLSTFDINTDTVLVQKGMLLLNPNGDYTIEGNKVVLSEAVREGQSIGIWVWKNVPLGEDGSVSGKVITDGSLPLSALEEVPVTVNKNLLHNWYFGNPVNRNGASKYMTDGKKNASIDRWYLYGNNKKNYIEILEDGVSFVSNTNTEETRFLQEFDTSITNELVGKILTFSMLADNEHMSFYVGDGTVSWKKLTAKYDNGLYTTTFTCPDFSAFTMMFQTGYNIAVTVKAVKLELGDQQTLAHQDENGNWVLNEIPDYAEQMAICSQYNASSGEYIGTPTFITSTVDLTAGVSTLPNNTFYVVIE